MAGHFPNGLSQIVPNLDFYHFILAIWNNCFVCFGKVQKSWLCQIYQIGVHTVLWRKAVIQQKLVDCFMPIPGVIGIKVLERGKCVNWFNVRAVTFTWPLAVTHLNIQLLHIPNFFYLVVCNSKSKSLSYADRIHLQVPFWIGFSKMC